MKPEYTFDAFDTLAGSSSGGYSSQDFVAELLEHVINIGGMSGADISDYQQIADSESEDGDTEADEAIDELIDWLSDHAILPPSCTLTMEDNEVRVIPYVDDELPRLSDYPDARVDGEDVIYVVNDHGNVTCQVWDGKAYVTVWEMV